MSENEHGPPLTPKSIKSTNTDSDRDSLGPTKVFGVEGNSDMLRRYGDSMSITSDISGLSGFSTMSHSSHHISRRRLDRQRPLVRKGRGRKVDKERERKGSRWKDIV